MKKKSIIILIVFFMFVGCAYTANNGMQRVVVRFSNNHSTDTTRCILTSNKGLWAVYGGEYLPVQVKRSPKDLIVKCKNRVGQEGKKVAESKMQWEYFFMDFILLDACTLSGIIDYFTGAFFEYPKQINVNMFPEITENNLKAYHYE